VVVVVHNPVVVAHNLVEALDKDVVEHKILEDKVVEEDIFGFIDKAKI